MLRRTTVFSSALLAVVAACSPDQNNPIPLNRSVPPPASAALVFTSNLHRDVAGGPREVFALNRDGSGLTQLTSCEDAATACDSIEAAPAPDRVRMAIRRSLVGVDRASLVYSDLTRGVEAELLPASKGVTGVDWSPTTDLLVFSAGPGEQLEDLFRIDWNGGNQVQLVETAGIAERRPRIDPTGTIAVFEYSEPEKKSQIWIFENSIQQYQVTSGGDGSEALTGTPYLVGSDTDPCFSPDGDFIVFRRLSSTALPGFGTWDIMTVRVDGSSPLVLAGGAAYRGAPDWGPNGIVFPESDGTEVRLVTVQPDGSGRQVLLSRAAGTAIDNPRWLR